jgi:hypothetical protein
MTAFRGAVYCRELWLPIFFSFSFFSPLVCVLYTSRFESN